MIRELSSEQPTGPLCRLLGVARSGYYAWLQGAESANDMKNRLLLEQIRQLFKASRGNYGSPRITQQLRGLGQRCNRKRVERLMRQEVSKDGLAGGARCARRTANTTSQLPPICCCSGRHPPRSMRCGWLI